MQPIECGALLPAFSTADSVIDEFSDDAPASTLDCDRQLATLVSTFCSPVLTRR